jgi:hypothetical protein
MNADKTLSHYLTLSRYLSARGKKNGKPRTAQDHPTPAPTLGGHGKDEQKIDTVEKMLEVLRVFFNDDFIEIEERKKLWNVLSALRGPDNEDGAAKLACVSQIRRAVAGQSFTDFGAYHRFDSAEDAKIRSKMTNCHFKLHMQAAFEALGLHWYDVNRPKNIRERLDAFVQRYLQ